MSDAVYIAIIGAVVAIANTVLTLLLGSKVKKVDNKVVTVVDEVGIVKKELGAVKTEINGHIAKLIEVTSAAEKAKGNLEGRSELASEGIFNKEQTAATTKEIINAVKENTIQAIKERNPLAEVPKEPIPVIVKKNEDK